MGAETGIIRTGKAIRAALRGTLKGSDDLIKIFDDSADDIVRAWRNGDLHNVKGAKKLLEHPHFRETSRKLDPDFMAKLEEQARAGEDVSRILSRRLGMKLPAQPLKTSFEAANAGTIKKARTASSDLTQQMDDLLKAKPKTPQTAPPPVPQSAIPQTPPPLPRTGTTPPPVPQNTAAINDAASEVNKLPFWSRVAANKVKIAFGVGTAGALLLVTEFASGHKLSSGAAGLTSQIAHGLAKIDPEIAKRFKEGGIEAVIFAAELNSTKRQAAINYTAEVLDNEGKHKEAVVIRAGGVAFSEMTYLDLMRQEKGERAEALVQRFETAGISREEITEYFNDNTYTRNMIEGRLNIELTTVLPELKAPEHTKDNIDYAVDKTKEKTIGIAETAKDSMIGTFAKTAQDTQKSFSILADSNASGLTKLGATFNGISQFLQLATNLVINLFKSLLGKLFDKTSNTIAATTTNPAINAMTNHGDIKIDHTHSGLINPLPSQ